MKFMQIFPLATSLSLNCKKNDIMNTNEHEWNRIVLTPSVNVNALRYDKRISLKLKVHCIYTAVDFVLFHGFDMNSNNSKRQYKINLIL